MRRPSKEPRIADIAGFQPADKALVVRGMGRNARRVVLSLGYGDIKVKDRLARRMAKPTWQPFLLKCYGPELTSNTIQRWYSRHQCRGAPHRTGQAETERFA